MFLFMAATVVSVVIFLCGVLVGRGVRSQLAIGSDSPVVDAFISYDPVAMPCTSNAPSEPTPLP